MKIPSNLVILFLFLLPSLAAGLPQDDVKISVFVTTVKQEGPLQITGFKLPDTVGGDPTVVVRNTSDKRVSDFSVAALLGNPEPDSRGEVGPKWSLAGPPRVLRPNRPIAPNSEGEAPATGLRAHYLAHWGGELHSTCLHVVATISSVKFADGATWELQASSQEIWKSSLGPDSTKTCDHSPAVENALNNWDGAAGNADTSMPSRLPTDAVQSYSFACPLRNLDGGLVAICPW